jgi:hypothetical protein
MRRAPVLSAVLLVLLLAGVLRVPSAAAQTTVSTTTVPPVGQGVFQPSIGLTRAQVEARFRDIDGNHTIFQTASKVKGVSRVLGGDKRLYTVVEINGYPAVGDLEVDSLLDTTSKTTLEDQIVYDSLVCGEFSNKAGQTWCLGRILDTNSKGLITATKSAVFGGLRMTVKTYRSSSGSNPPVVAIDIAAS